MTLFLLLGLTPSVHASAETATPASGDAAGGVGIVQGNLQRTGEMPGPGPTGEPVVRWRYALGEEVDSTPAVAGGVVYIGSQVERAVLALDAATGQERWRVAVGKPINSSPVVVDGALYIGAADGNVYALDREDGTERWRFATGGAVSSSPTVVDGLVFVGSDDGNLYAIGGS